MDPNLRGNGAKSPIIRLGNRQSPWLKATNAANLTSLQAIPAKLRRIRIWRLDIMYNCIYGPCELRCFCLRDKKMLRKRKDIDLELIYRELEDIKRDLADLKEMIRYSPGLRTAYIGNNISMIRTSLGKKMYIDSRDIGIASNLMIRGYWELGYTKFLMSKLNKGQCFVDVGANFGYYSIIAASLVGDKGKVYAIEPNPFLASLIEKSCKANGYNNVSILKIAASNSTDGAVLNYINGDYGGGSLVSSGNDKKEHLYVPTAPLDDVISEKDVHMVKIDVEGFEIQVLQGMKEIVKRNPDIIILMEYTPILIERAGCSKKDLVDFVDEFGLKIFYIDRTTGKLQKITPNKVGQGYYVLTRRKM